VTSARAEAPRIAVSSAGPDASLIAATLRSPSPSPIASPTPAVVTLPPQALPTPARQTPVLRPYSRSEPHCFCVGVESARGSTVTAPFAGTLERHVYQLISGQVREGTDVAGIPSYPYVIVIAADGRRMTYRPGALGTDTQLIADRTPVKAGDELFRVIGDGPSSWRDFYDRSISFQIVVSLVAASGTDLDPTNLIRFQ
jgi:hypothetical protein